MKDIIRYNKNKEVEKMNNKKWVDWAIELTKSGTSRINLWS